MILRPTGVEGVTLVFKAFVAKRIFTEDGGEMHRICTSCHDAICWKRKAQTEPDHASPAKPKDHRDFLGGLC